MRQHALTALLTTAVLLTPLAAQRSARGGLAISSRPSFSHRPFFRPGFYRGSPFWADDYSSDHAQSPVYVIQTQSETSPKPGSSFEEPKHEAPLMIEWQGDHYVRHTADTAPNSAARPPDYVASSSSLRSQSAALAPAATLTEPPPAIFVFRDGHREQSSDYSIISGVIYSRGNYWTTGSWSKKILIADLDVAATLQANREQGVPFRLPGAYNEVITRP